MRSARRHFNLKLVVGTLAWAPRRRWGLERFGRQSTASVPPELASTAPMSASTSGGDSIVTRAF